MFRSVIWQVDPSQVYSVICLLGFLFFNILNYGRFS